ncbi:MAG: hypothetical protein AUH19_10160 [Verrucomicrobia bacterium 13_2_20CM_55_10]|nr:MAG: hypothetical protein AUH19_10160 [Verrucomicrobia bacterium 13_2_20CM_55_10]PYI66522.1 MAG: hypothetical protein DMF07_03790 [Verrucomicrobiota bacterium]
MKSKSQSVHFHPAQERAAINLIAFRCLFRLGGAEVTMRTLNALFFQIFRIAAAFGKKSSSTKQ